MFEILTLRFLFSVVLRFCILKIVVAWLLFCAVRLSMISCRFLIMSAFSVSSSVYNDLSTESRPVKFCSSSINFVVSKVFFCDLLKIPFVLIFGLVISLLPVF